MKTPLVSIIVPVYKAEKWLHRCVDSILAQTMEDFELLLIDDGSPDRSGEICDEYAAKDSRVRVFHKENGGVSSARNLGLDNAQGEWISFVDADDWVEVDYLAGLTENLDADFITGGMRDTQGNVCVTENRLYSNVDIREFIEQHNGGCFVRVVWGKLLRREIIEKNRIRFDEKIRFGEDTIFNKQVLLYSDTVRIVNFKGYIYYFDEDFFENGKGVFDKYSLKFEEVDYVASVLVDINRRLDARFGCCSHKEEGKLYFLQAIKFEDIEKHGLNEYYKLCKKFYPNLSLEEFYSDSLLSPIVKYIVNIKRLYKIRSLNNIENIFNSSEIFKELPWRVRFQHKDFYLWYFLIKCGWWNIFNFLMKMYFRIKKL